RRPHPRRPRCDGRRSEGRAGRHRLGGQAMSAEAAVVRDLLTTPDDAAVERALRSFARAVEGMYGERLRGIYLFGSRARGDHRPESDADVAIVLADGDWQRWEETMRIADLEYDTIVTTG